MKIPSKLMAFKYYTQEKIKEYPFRMQGLEDIYYELMLKVAKEEATDEDVRKSYLSAKDLINMSVEAIESPFKEVFDY